MTVLYKGIDFTKGLTNADECIIRNDQSKINQAIL